MSTKKPANFVRKPFYKNKILIIILIIIAIPAIYISWYLISQKTALYYDQQKFIAAKQSSDLLFQKLKTQLPQYSWKSEAKCETVSTESYFSRRCWTRDSSAINVTSEEQGKSVVNDINNIAFGDIQGLQLIRKKADIYPDFARYISTPVERIKEEGQPGQDIENAFYKVSDTNLYCKLISDISSQDVSHKTVSLSVSFSCEDDALQEWFS
jgi:hypothetical protein